MKKFNSLQNTFNFFFEPQKRFRIIDIAYSVIPVTGTSIKSNTMPKTLQLLLCRTLLLGPFNLVSVQNQYKNLWSTRTVLIHSICLSCCSLQTSSYREHTVLFPILFFYAHTFFIF